jgi:hypothetical protein
MSAQRDAPTLGGTRGVWTRLRRVWSPLAASDQPLMIFMHVPKTGGTTLSHVLRRYSTRESRVDHDSYLSIPRKIGTLSAKERARISWILGHYAYGIHAGFKGTPTYFVLLREPVERVLSNYSFLLTYPGSEYLRDWSPERFADEHPEGSNLQVKMLCGPDVAPDLEVAKRRLEGFAAFGLTERFDDSLQLLKARFGWEDMRYRTENVTQGRLRQEQLSDRVLAIIRRRNALDTELFAFATDLFQSRLDSLSSPCAPHPGVATRK